MIPTRKRWGQHFLANPATAEKIVALAGVQRRDTVIEVGPGDGALTRPLARAVRRLLAIEIDPLRAGRLQRERIGDEAGEVLVIEGDVLSRRFGEWLAQAGWSGPVVVVGNLPYNVATRVLLSAIEERETVSRVVAMVQREVARRFVAVPGSEEYGYLSVRAAAFARARILLDLPPSAFRPRPKVASSLLELCPHADLLEAASARAALALAAAGFQARRKTLANALSPSGGRARWERLLAHLGKDRRIRAEQLALTDWVELARASEEAAESAP